MRIGQPSEPKRVRYIQEDRRDLIARLEDPDQLVRSGVFRKTARIIAVQPEVGDFEVETDRGMMQAKAGDWLVTNHPDDDSGSDVWTISDERMKATYEPTNEG